MAEQNLIQTVRTLERRAESLEKEAALLRQELARVAEALAASSLVVARYTIEGETYEITEADVEAVRVNLAKSWPDEAVQELAVAKKVAARLRKLSPDEQDQHLYKTVEAIRSAAISNGTAIESETEAVIDD